MRPVQAAHLAEPEFVPYREPTPRSLIVIVKPTTRCNAACRYCSAHTDEHRPRMTLDVVRLMYRRFADYTRDVDMQDITLIWHGGEPLLLGREFYQQAWAEAEDLPGLHFFQLVQTNLLLLDGDWIDLMHRFRVQVGSSVDPLGPDRVLRDGRNQLPLWMEKFELAARMGLKVGVVFVVTPAHLHDARRIYDFLHDLHRVAGTLQGVRINPMYPAGAASAFEPADWLRPGDYARFLLEIREFWEADQRPFPIHPLASWRAGTPGVCEFSSDCTTRLLAVDSLGQVYHCGRYMDMGCRLGHLDAAPLAEILAHPRRQALARRSRLLRAGPCRECEHWALCHGGCPYHSELVHGSPMRASPFCEAFAACLGSLFPADGSH